MGWWQRFIDKIVGEEPPDPYPEPRIIALSRGSSWEDYPQHEVMEVHQAYAAADLVIDVFGVVVKDYEGPVGRRATEEEIRKATTV